jgi:hypothetical protein
LNTKKIGSNLKQSKHIHQKNRFTQYETGSNKVKLPKVGSNAIVLGTDLFQQHPKAHTFQFLCKFSVTI